MGEGKRGRALEGVLWLVPPPSHPNKPQRSELFFPPSFKEGAKVEGILPREELKATTTRQCQSGPPSSFYCGGWWRGRGRREGCRKQGLGRSVRPEGSPGKAESSGLQVRGRVAEASEGRGLLLPLTCRAKAELQPRRRAVHGFSDGTSWRAGPRQGPRGRWGAFCKPLPGQVAGGGWRVPEPPACPAAPPLAAPLGLLRPARGWGPGPTRSALLLLAAARSPASPDTSPPPGAASRLPLAFDSPGSAPKKVGGS